MFKLRKRWADAVRKTAVLLRYSGLMEASLLIAVFLSALSFLALIQLSDEVLEGETGSFDQSILMAFRSDSDISDPIGPLWFEEMMRDFTALGGFAVLLTLTLAIAGFLFLTHKRHAGWMVLWSIGSGMLVSSILKWGFARPRPDLVPHATAVYTKSFPSGHAMLSAIVYLTLGTLLARTQARKRVKFYLLSMAGLLTLIVGTSRVYLGVHWPTDVLAGWAGGAGWALLSWAVMLWLQARGKVEPPTDGGD